MAPVPEAGSRNTSPEVAWSSRSHSVTRRSTVRNASVRWWGGTCARARSTRGGISTGPGVKRRVLGGGPAAAMSVGVVRRSLALVGPERRGALRRAVQGVLEHLVHGLDVHELQVRADVFRDLGD